MQGLKPRPGERCQQEVVQEEGSANTQPDRWVERQPAIQQEDQVEEEEGHAELNQDLGRNIPEQLSAEKEFVRIRAWLWGFLNKAQIEVVLAW